MLTSVVLMSFWLALGSFAVVGVVDEFKETFKGEE